MKFITAIIAMLATGIMASPFDGVPKCAIGCAVQFVGDSGCNEVDDFKCLCSSKSFIDGVRSCIPNACKSGNDAEVSLGWARKTCEKVGVNIA